MIAYFLLGGAFGAVLLEAEVISWFRIQEMFRFDAFHMYGIIGSAVLVAGLSLLVIKRLQLRTADGAAIGLPPKRFGSGTRYIAGGAIFGLGWALSLPSIARLTVSTRSSHSSAITSRRLRS